MVSTILNIKQINKFHGTLYFSQLLDKYSNFILTQIDNLRSTNAKEAIVLVTEIIQHQKFNLFEMSITQAFINALFTKSVCQKNFLKKQALIGLNKLGNYSSPILMDMVITHTLSTNGTIAQIAIQTLYRMVQSGKGVFSVKFLKQLAANIDGKRAIIVRKAKQILLLLRDKLSEQELIRLIDQQTIQNDNMILKNNLKNNVIKDKRPTLKQFIKNKKAQTN